MTPGMIRMPLWSAESWDSPLMVTVNVAYSNELFTLLNQPCVYYPMGTCTGAVAVTSGIFSDDSQYPILSGVQCTGSETDLLSCSHSNYIDGSSCGTHDDAGVVCQGG